MPKIRTIKPEFWIESDLAGISVWARCFYIGLWNFCDDDGVFEWKPVQLKAQIFPYDSVDAETLLKLLEERGKVRRFTFEGRDYGIVPSFSNHQKIDERYRRVLIERLSEAKIEYHDVTTTGPRRVHVVGGGGGGGGGREVEVTTDANASVSAGADVLDEFEEFLTWLNRSKIFPAEKTATAKARQKWKSRRAKYDPRKICEAFGNLLREPDRWKIKHNGSRPLSWWLDSDDRIEDMLQCHLKSGKRGVALISDEYGRPVAA